MKAMLCILALTASISAPAQTYYGLIIISPDWETIGKVLSFGIYNPDRRENIKWCREQYANSKTSAINIQTHADNGDLDAEEFHSLMEGQRDVLESLDLCCTELLSKRKVRKLKEEAGL